MKLRIDHSDSIDTEAARGVSQCWNLYGMISARYMLNEDY